MSQPAQRPQPETAEGQKLRRLACDRCRGQKLKCVRLGLSEKCQRCTTADAICTFGKPLPPGRRATKPAAQKMEVESTVPKLPVAVSRTELESTSVLNEISAPVGILHADSPGFSESLWVHGSDMDADNFYNILYDEGGAIDLDGHSLDTWPAKADSMGDTSPWQTMGPIGDEGDTLVFSPHEGRSPQSQKRLSTTQSKREGPTKRPASQTSGSTAGSLDEAATTPDTMGLMQHLMHLSRALYELESRYLPNGDSNHTLMAAYGVFPTELSGQVLQAAIDFLAFLQCFFLVDEPSSYSPGQFLATNRRDQSFLDLTDLDQRSCLHAYGTLVPPPYEHIYLAPTNYGFTHSSALEWPPARQIATPDKPTSQQLISNYMRLLRLYLLLHKCIYDYVRLTASNPSQRQPIWSNMTLGGTVLDQFADFQIKLVLQVVARLLEDIEVALGLPEGCRVGKMAAAENGRRGILGTYVSTHFIEMCMFEATAGPDQGRYTIIRLRDIMHRLSSALDTPTVC
ncbi:Zn(II)2Cys6 transcription factor domain-containing protein [Aspergillus mulundensis]|uniref:Zn(2)-C6 fungal-type domain-containing protein n=1 Tax=Aspergillus mulundensis TaxID=1810919 RepID=A0A3D8T5X9_9EURO|nr:hypothetical protein DSM5745_01261 [Aspergillus mulundensis]RDW93939.1 hypothetical protein DSM5745_01261 [Aspergillus mulundensis]